MTARPLPPLRNLLALGALAALGRAVPLCAQAAPPAVEEPRTPFLDAGHALEEGRGFAASRLLAPLLATPGPHDRRVLLLAARAAAEWSGWGTIVRLLSGETWLDQDNGGEGRALLAAARLERGEDAALADARQAVSSAPPEELGARVVTLARALDRAGLFDSAAWRYRQAAGLFPTISDWLLLRAAGVTADSAERASIFRRVTGLAAVTRLKWTDALARDRSGDAAGAARVYESLGATLAAVRLRLRGAPDSAALHAARRELRGLLTPRTPPEDSRAAIELLDRSFAPLAWGEELLVARRAAALDRLSRAAQGFARAGRGRRLAESDRLTYGTVLARLGRHKEAIALLSTITARELLPLARYHTARSLIRAGSRPAGLALLRRVATEVHPDTATGAMAGFLLADLLADDGDTAGARQAYRDVAERYRGTPYGPRAAFQAAMILYLGGDAKGASAEFLTASERWGDRSEGIAALYWGGRALAESGDTAAAGIRWRGLLEKYPNSYYTVPAARRLGTAPVLAPPDGTAPPADSATRAAMDRGLLLERLGLRVEARFEYELATRFAEASATTLVATAAAFAERGLTGRAYRLALRAADRGAPHDAALERLLFPIPGGSGFVADAREAGVDPLLAAALIRQESAFDPSARSHADARGLMQVMPAVGASLARAGGIREWDVSLLDDAEVNRWLGLTHLADALRRQPRLEDALAAYNAGAGPVAQWRRRPGADDPEVFVERIQYLETRDYVRRVLRNLAAYRALYPSLP